MSGSGWSAVITLAVVVSCGGGGTAIDERPDLAELLPEEAGLAGWTIAEGPAKHTPETLFEYLNGGAERYLSSGFRALLHVRYQYGDDPLACVTLDVYDMSGDLGAFGIYSAARPPGVQAEPWGAEGYRLGTIAAAFKGALYVHGEADDEQPELISMLELLVSGVCKRAAGDGSWPSVLAPLPVDGRVVHSERYVPTNLLGHSFLPGGVLAAYEIEGRRAELFISCLENEDAAEEALDMLRSHLAKRSVVEEDAPLLRDSAFRYSDVILGDGTAARAGSHVAGIHGDMSSTAREAILAGLLDALDSSAEMRH